MSTMHSECGGYPKLYCALDLCAEAMHMHGGSMQGNVNEISDQRRDLIFRVMDDQQALLPVLHYFTRWKRCDDILSWLLINNLIGKNLLEWTHKCWGNSLLSMCKYILGRIEQTPNRKAFMTDLVGH